MNNNNIRRQDRATSIEESVDLLRNGEFGILSMCSTDNEGYGIPINYVFDSDRIYFHCAIEGTKLKYLRSNNKVSFCVIGETKIMPSQFGTLYNSAIVFGEIIEIEEDEKREALMLFIKKYSSEFMNEGIEYINKLYDRVKILKLPIDTMTGKSRKH